MYEPLPSRFLMPRTHRCGALLRLELGGTGAGGWPLECEHAESKTDSSGALAVHDDVL